MVTDAPIVAFDSHAGGEVIDQYTTISFEISASDDDGIAKIELYNSSELLGEAILDDATATYKYEYTANAWGELNLIAYATDTLGRVSSHALPAAIVTKEWPTLSVISPTENSVFYLGTPVDFEFSASAGDGIAKVAHNSYISVIPYSTSFQSL